MLPHGECTPPKSPDDLPVFACQLRRLRSPRALSILLKDLSHAPQLQRGLGYAKSQAASAVCSLQTLITNRTALQDWTECSCMNSSKAPEEFESGQEGDDAGSAQDQIPALRKLPSPRKLLFNLKPFLFSLDRCRAGEGVLARDPFCSCFQAHLTPHLTPNP